MEDIAVYIFLLFLGLGGFYLYQTRKAMVKQFPLSIQTYSGCIVKVMLKKQHGKIQQIIVRVIARTGMTLESISVEMIDSTREFYSIGLTDGNNAIPMSMEKNRYYDMVLPYDDFIKKVKNHDKPFRTFRFAVETGGKKKYKSHELAFNKNLIIYRPDSGRYN